MIGVLDLLAKVRPVLLAIIGLLALAAFYAIHVELTEQAALEVRIQYTREQLEDATKEVAIFEDEVEALQGRIKLLVDKIKENTQEKGEQEIVLAEAVARWKVLKEHHDRVKSMKAEIDQKVEALYLIQRQFGEVDSPESDVREP